MDEGCFLAAHVGAGTHPEFHVEVEAGARNAIAQPTLRLGGRETQLSTNGYVSVPRGTNHSFARRGNRPFVLLAALSGEPCEQAR